MALSLDTVRKTRSRAKQAWQAKNAEVFYFGSLVGLLPSTGRAEKWSDTDGLLFLGKAAKACTGNTAATPPVEVMVDQEGEVNEDVAVAGLAGTVADNGRLVYATDDGTFTLTPTILVGAVGWIHRWRTAAVADVCFFTPREYEQRNQPLVVSLPITLAQITGAGDVLTTWTPGFAGRIVKAAFAVTTVVTTAAKAATLNLEIGTTNLTGGTIALTSANCTPLGAVVAAAAITAGNRFAASDTVSVEASSVTAFAEGAGVLLLTVIRD